MENIFDLIKSFSEDLNVGDCNIRLETEQEIITFSYVRKVSANISNSEDGER